MKSTIGLYQDSLTNTIYGLYDFYLKNHCAGNEDLAKDRTIEIVESCLKNLKSGENFSHSKKAISELVSFFESTNDIQLQFFAQNAIENITSLVERTDNTIEY